MMEVNKCKLKFKLLFDKFFEENYELSSYYSGNILKFLEDNPDKSAKILETPFFSDLIIHSLTNIEHTTNSVKTFVMELITILLRNELQFSKFCQMHGFIMVREKLYALPTSTRSNALQLAGIKLVIAQTSHYSGIMWLAENKVWTHILSPRIHHKSSKVANAAYNFISRLVWKLNEYDEEAALTEVLQFIVKPLKTSGYTTITEIDTDNEEALYDPILSYLHALYAILSDIEISNVGANKVIPLLTRYFIVEPSVRYIFGWSRVFDLICLTSDLTFRFVFASCKDAVARKSRPESDIPTEMIRVYYNIIHLLLQKRKIPETIDFVVKCAIFWAKVDGSEIPLTLQLYDRSFDVRNQFIMLVVAPLLSYSYCIHHERKNHAMIEALDVYTIKLSNITTEHIVKAGYALKPVIENNELQKTVICTLKALFKLKGYLNVAQAGILYQALYYTLQIHVISDGSGGLIINDSPLKTPDDVKLLSLVLEAIKMLLKEHNINWYENVEIISLQTTLMDLLKQNFMPTKQLLQAMDLINLSVQKFLSPDMALLMESKRGSTLNEISNIMKLYIQHEEWEVRDSALHLLLSCTEVAFVKYVSLQKLLSENNLMSLAAHAALSDEEFYVQVTALRCLAAATKIEGIWQEVLIDHPNLYMQLIYIFKNNPEGIVRKEAANVLSEAQMNQKLSKGFTNCLYNVMTVAALNDMHWEVQICALNFWKNVIHRHMSDRGMIDGKFPSVTFSKEKRKIITLNEKEILKQLAGIMNDLSVIGCLNVLYECLNEEYNVEVVEQAYNVTKELIVVLDRYKFDIVSENQLVPIESNNIEMKCEQDMTCGDEAMDLSCAAQRNQLDLREQVIDSILNTNHEHLLNELYANHFQIKSDEIDDSIPILTMDLMDPCKFLRKFKETDYLSAINIKKKWNSGPSNLDFLLDETLQLGEIKRDVGDDCID